MMSRECCLSLWACERIAAAARSYGFVCFVMEKCIEKGGKRIREKRKKRSFQKKKPRFSLKIIIFQ